MVSNCEFVTFPLVSMVRCGTWLYRFLIFAPLLTLQPDVQAQFTLSQLGLVELGPFEHCVHGKIDQVWITEVTCHFIDMAENRKEAEYTMVSF